MKKIYTTFIAAMLIISSFAQSYLTPGDGFNANDIFPDMNTLSSFDVAGNTLYANSGAVVFAVNMETGDTVFTSGKPDDYTGWPSFLTVSDDEQQIWVGYTTSGNTDDRIFLIDVNTGNWKQVAGFTANFDLELLGGKILVSGLNSAEWDTPSGVFLLDTTGNNAHKKIIEVGGSAAGFSIDSKGNVYYATYHSAADNFLYRWDSLDIVNAYTNGDTLVVDDATVLSALPDGAYDCDVDAAGNVLISINSYTGAKGAALWNGTASADENVQFLGTTEDAYDWITYIKSTGDVTMPGEGNAVYLLSYARPIAKITRQLPPVLVQDLGPVSAFEDAENVEINLDYYFKNVETTGAREYELVTNTVEAVAAVSQVSSTITIDFLAQGQTNVVIKATANGVSTFEKLVVGVQPRIESAYTVSDFQDLTLEENSYWNGSDESGEFTTGLLNFPNTYNTQYAYWGGWAYSNVNDTKTEGYMNQYAAITGYGVDTIASEGKNYGQAYVGGTNKVFFTDTLAHNVEGFFVTNATYTALSMQNGDAYAKAFGGETGNDPDYFKLMVWGFADGENTADTVEFFLADYRFEDNNEDYIVKTWQWIDLTVLGAVDSLGFGLASSDMGDWGMNTPAYLSVDNFYVGPGIVSVQETEAQALAVYPNPSNGKVRVSTGFNVEACPVAIYNMNGQKVYENTAYSQLEDIDLSNQAPGLYIVKVVNKGTVSSQVIVIE
jgi:hypothetical protein